MSETSSFVEKLDAQVELGNVYVVRDGFGPGIRAKGDAVALLQGENIKASTL
jgi:hypothetical protein